MKNFKYEKLEETYIRKCTDVVASSESWQDFLKSACHNYRLRFDEQLLIYEQKPDATAVLEIERWRSKFGRWVNRGATGIAVFVDDTREVQKLKYYFDISDTHPGKGSREVPIWKMKEKYESEVIDTLEANFGSLENKDTLTHAILSAAHNLVEDNLQDYLSELLKTVDGSFLSEVSEDTVTAIYKKIAGNSVAYMMMTRLDLPTENCFGEMGFFDIFDFNTPETLTALGIAVSDISEMALAEIRNTIVSLDKRIIDKDKDADYNAEKDINETREREMKDEQDNLYNEGRLSSSESEHASTDSENPGKIRRDEETVSEDSTKSSVLQLTHTSEIDRASLRNGTESVENGTRSDRKDEERRGSHGRPEGTGYDAMGRSDEQYKESSAGNRDQRRDLQLDPTIKVPPSIEEQGKIVPDYQAEEKSSAFEFTQELIDTILCRGSGFENGKMRIYEQFQKDLSNKENAAFLKNEYGWGGVYPVIDDPKISEMHSPKGIKLSKGLSEGAPEILLKWKDVAKRVKQLISMERYLNPKEQEKYPKWLEEQKTKRQEQTLREQTKKILEREPAEENKYEFQYHEGDHLYLGSQEYEILSVDENRVLLYDFNMPLFNKELTRKELEQEILDNPSNDHLRIEVIEEPNLSNKIGRIDYLGTDGTVQESVEYDDEVQLKKQLEDDSHYGVPTSVTIYDNLKEPSLISKEFLASLDPPPKLLNIEEKDVNKSLEGRLLDFIKAANYYEFADNISAGDSEESLLDKLKENLQNDLQIDGLVKELEELIDEIEYDSELKEEGNTLLNEIRMEQAKRLINDFSEREYGSSISFDNLNEIGIAYTTTEDEKHEIQVNLDLNKFEIRLYVDDHLIKKDSYDSLPEFVDLALKRLEFDDLVYVSGEEMEKIKDENIPAEKKKSKQRVGSFIIHPEVPMEERNNFNLKEFPIETVGKKERYKRNVDAIQVLKICEDEDRLATPGEQVILSKYVGWGGIPEAFDERNSSWGKEYLELKSLLTEEDYESSRESTLTSFYTPPEVIDAVYKVFDQIGFKEGNILEPSCGIGHFIGMLPDSMSKSKIYGVEIDTISAKIAQQLYQKSTIAAQGYESVNLPDSFFDGVVGNVPFGDFKVIDKRYDKHKFLIHDYFFAKSLDKLRPGGVMALVTSKGTMDKANPTVRKYIAQRADLLGAIRLPNNTFKGNAGTEVVSDILFLQKRDRVMDIDPDWVNLDADENGVRMNSYFVKHPEMILGEMKRVTGRFGEETTCVPYENVELKSLLNDAVVNINGKITEYEMEDEIEEDDQSIPADPSVRNFSYTIVDDEIYYRENSRMKQVNVSVTKANRIKGMIKIRDSVRNLIELQLEDYSEEEIREEQKKLNDLYDSYTKKYGLINTRGNTSAFSDDASYSLISALEVIDQDGKLERKADMFYKRTIMPHRPVTAVDTVEEALVVSMGEKAIVDMEYMEQLCGEDEESIYERLKGKIFFNPEYEDKKEDEKYIINDEYLSGNIREKLRKAKLLAEIEPDKYQINVDALTNAMPKNLSASEIEVRLGATWLPPKIVEQFMYHLLRTPRYLQWDIGVHYSPVTSEWNISGKAKDRGNIRAYNTYGTKRINAYKIIEETLNLKDVRIYDRIEDEEGKRKSVLNKKETAIAQGKQEQIKQEFRDWIWSDPDRREYLTELYNEKFNSIRPREYDGGSIVFSGMNPEITLKEHQRNAVAHILYGGNTLLAHAVGAGKTFEMVAAAQELKRLGLCNKAMFVVPNHLIEQWASEYLQLYPAANILVATKKDFDTKNRKRFCGRIATGEYDAIILGHSQFEKIPISDARQKVYLEQQLKEITEGIDNLKRNRGENFSIKEMEKMKKSIKKKLEDLNDPSRKDNVVTFEELGVDRLFIDESHYYKNLFLYTKMRNVGGIAQTEAKKSSGLFMKCRYLDEITGGRGVIFATGTPISNSMVELYTIQRYLQYGTLEKYGLQNFDAWASTFGETVTAVELTPEGSGYRAKTRFANFYNLPELMSMFKEVADIKTADMLNLPVPKANFHNIAVKPSEIQKEIVASLADRAERVRNGMVDSAEDNMLKITNDGRKLALDQRLINDMLEDFPGSKLNACVDNIYQIWEKTKERRSTQLFFCDLSTPKSSEGFSVYDDVKKKLVEKGIPEEEIQFIHDANTDAKKQEMFKKTRTGDIRVLMGSTQKMGAGTNVQDKLIALHNLDCPWRPSDLEQRLGRIVRQGNENKEVEIFRYVTEETFDAYLYQLIEGKQKFASQIMTSKSPVRSAEDIDETALSYAEIKMLATGNPNIKEKMDLDIQVQKLKLLKSNYLSEKYALEDKTIKYYPQRIKTLISLVEALKKDIETAKKHPKLADEKFIEMTIKDVFYLEKMKAGEAILNACGEMTNSDPVPLGEYRGFKMDLFFDSFAKVYNVKVKGESSVNVVLGQDVRGNIVRIDNAIEKLEERLLNAENELENTRDQFEIAKVELEKPFQKEGELNEKLKRLNELNILLDIDKKENEIVDVVVDSEESDRRKEKNYER